MAAAGWAMQRIGLYERLEWKSELLRLPLADEFATSVAPKDQSDGLGNVGMIGHVSSRLSGGVSWRLVRQCPEVARALARPQPDQYNVAASPLDGLRIRARYWHGAHYNADANFCDITLRVSPTPIISLSNAATNGRRTSVGFPNWGKRNFAGCCGPVLSARSPDVRSRSSRGRISCFHSKRWRCATP